MRVSDLVNATVLGSTYTLLALSWVMIYRGTRVLNFGIGQLMFLGALVVTTATASGQPYLVAILAGLVVSGVLAGVTYITVIRPLTGRDAFSSVVLAIGVSIMVAAAISIIWGPNVRNMPRPIESRAVTVLGTRVSVYGLVNIALAVVVVVGLVTFFRYARTGLLMRAAAELPLLASQRGVNVFLVFAVAWGISGALAALGGITYATTTVVAPSLAQLGLRGIAPALVGGFRSIGGATAGAFLIAYVEIVGTRLLGGAAQDAVVFAALLVLIAVRPQGLNARAEVSRV